MRLTGNRRDAYFHPDQGLAWVARGFCWPAFFFGGLWAASRRMGALIIAVWLLIDLMVWLLTTWLEAAPAHPVASSAIDLAVALTQGACGHAWLRRSLQRRGYRALATRP